MCPATPSNPTFGYRLGVIALVAVVYFLGAAFGLSLASLSKQVSPVWPPTGIALAALLLLGSYVWPGIALGAFAINALTGPWSAALGISAGNTLEAVVGATLLRQYVGFHCALDRPRDVVGLVVCSAVISTAISATVGVASLCLGHVEPWTDFARLWWTWWLGDAMGALMVAPLLLIGTTWLRGGEELPRPSESLFFVVSVTVVSFLVFGGHAGPPLELKYLVFPLFVWSALRLGQMTTATGIALAVGFAIYRIRTPDDGVDPAALNTRVLLMQTFLSVLAVCSLILGAVVLERERISTERNALLESEQAARAEAERMTRQKDDFVATLSHELRTPLNGLLGWTHVLKRSGHDPDVAREGLASVERCARSLAQLMDDLMDMTRVISGKMSLRMQKVDLAITVENALDMIRPEAIAKKIELSTTVEPGTVVMGDPSRLQQVLCNLLSNAVKFTPSSGRVAVVLDKSSGQAVLDVRDSGMGIDPDFLTVIFDRFRQADSSTTRRYGGLGLGLAIVRHIVQLHGGSVAAQSPGIGQGATFSIRIPLASDDTAGEVAAASNESNRMAGTPIIVLDDDAEACELLRRILTEHGAQIVTAQSAEQALALVLEQPRLLLSDIGLPDMDGYQLIRNIRGHANAEIRNIPAIAVTAFARPLDVERALQAGFNAHVGKPVDEGELITAIDQVLRAAMGPTVPPPAMVSQTDQPARET